jgi:multiple sugar transport system permease protein
MSAEAIPQSRVANDRVRRDRAIDVGGLLLSAITFAFALAAFFPIYWAVVTSFKSETEVVAPQYRGL